MHRDGYGFVTPEPDSLPPRARGKLLGDVFIPPPEIGNAMHGDQVLVELGRIRADGKGEGRILRVTEREQETVVGIFHYGAHHNYLKPFDEKIGMEIIIPHGMEYPKAQDEDEFQASEQDGEVKTSGFSKHRGAQPPSAAQGRPTPHRVLGEEALRKKDWHDLENVVVEVEIIQFPSATHEPRGRVVEILGYEDDFG